MATRGKHWVSEPDQEMEIQLTPSGFGATPAKTVMQVLNEAIRKNGNGKALCMKRPVNGKVPDEWQSWTWNEFYRDARKFAKTLIYLDVKPFHIVNILGFNSPEWILSLVGAVLCGCIGAGIYTTNLPEACHYISEHSKAEVVVLENNKQLAKYATMAHRLPHLKAIVIWEEDPNPDLVAQCGKAVYTWAAFLALGEHVSDAVLDDRLLSAKPGHCASLIYTSGTTGPPKATMISHDNITWTTRNICQHYMDLNHTDRVVSYLPLSHIAAQLIDIFCVMDIAGTLYFAQPDALKGTLTVTLKQVRPTFFFGVPRVWEKIQEKMVDLGRANTGLKKSIADWAKSVGLQKSRNFQFGASRSAPFGFGCANSLVFTKVKEALGLDQCKAMFTAAAPISTDTLWYFASLDIAVWEVFGQSECTGPHTVSSHGNWKVGTCGRPMRGTTSKIVAETGELCYKGRHIFMGYMYSPEETIRTIDDEGYLHSGDVAEFDADNHPDVSAPSGFMRITGRIKELLITAGGENIPPVLIENAIKSLLPAVSNVMVIGDRRKYLTALVSLKCDPDLETMMPTDRLAADALHAAKTQLNSNVTLYSQAKVDQVWFKYVNDGIKKANSQTTSQAQIIQKWRWLPEDFSEKAGDLTPTLKLKRKVVTEKYASLIDSIYDEDAEK